MFHVEHFLPEPNRSGCSTWNIVFGYIITIVCSTWNIVDGGGGGSVWGGDGGERRKDGRKGRGKAASSVVSDAVVQHLHAGRACGESVSLCFAQITAASGVVPPAGIEPASLAASDFESDASTNSATGANGRG